MPVESAPEAASALQQGQALIPVGIGGFGLGLPEWEVDNEYFTRFVDTSDEWIQQRTGIRTRRWIRDGEKPSDLFVAAGQEALETAGVAPEDVDMVIAGTVSGDYTVPATACIIQDRLGCRNAGAFDLNAACTGFVYALSLGRNFVATGQCRRVLVMGGEALSRISDIYDRNSCVLFGDGAGAALLQPHEECGQGLIEDITLGADGRGYHFIMRPKGGGIEPVTPEILAEGTHLLRMKGREVYRFTVQQMTELMAWALEGVELDEVGVIVPHQMNKRILETCCEKLGLPLERVYINIARVGNTSAGTVPICLAELQRAGRLEAGKLVVLAAFGAGLTWGAARIRW